MPMTDSPHRSLRALTLVELAVSSLVVLAMAAALLPMLGSGLRRSGMMVSANNLRTLAQGYAAYEASWGGRQFSYLREDMGGYSGCSSYSMAQCPPQLILGHDDDGSLWGFFINGNTPECHFLSGCNNWPMLVPLPLGGSSTVWNTANGEVGSCYLPNARGPREYVASRYFDPVYYSPNDSLVYGALSASDLLAYPFEFPAIKARDAQLPSFYSSYAYSPAALWGTCVLRSVAEGGVQVPGSCPASYRTPSANQATYPDLKTRMMESRWCQDPPRLANPQFAQAFPYHFNAGPESRPGALFFDGHVSFASLAEYEADDRAALMQTGTDGLWSRDTIYGTAGIFGTNELGSSRASPNFLTTGGITGRDLLHAR